MTNWELYQNNILAKNGISVRIEDKQRKFGRRDNLGTSWQAVLDTYSTSTLLKEYPTTNTIDSLVCSDAAFAGMCWIEGLFIDANDDNKYKTHKWQQEANGQTPVTLLQPLVRCFRVFNKSDESLATGSDTVSVYAADGVTVTGGVPQTEQKIHCSFNGEQNQSQQAEFATAYDEYWYGHTLKASIQKSGTPTAKIRIQVREFGNVWRNVFTGDISKESPLSQRWEPFLIVSPNHDVRVTVLASTTNVTLEAELNGFIATVT